MKMHLTADAVMGALAESFSEAWSTRAGTATVERQPDAAAGPGLLARWTFSGAVQGPAAVWFDTAPVVDAARALGRFAAGAPDTDLHTFLREVLVDAVAAFAARAPFTGAVAGDIELIEADAPAGHALYALTAAGQPTLRIACWADVTAPSAQASAVREDRLSAVLEVELPLVVRFGRAVMPFRALAALGPGSVVDMGRSPEEPVELLVGDRLIARGEVVIVGGNYGVRITELTGARHIAAGLEARAS